MKNKKVKIIIVSVVVLILLGLIFLIPHQTKAPETQTILVSQKNTPSPSLPLTKGEKKGGADIIQTTLEINGVSYKSEINTPDSVYDFMKQLKNEGKIDFTAENYIGMGEFINGINGVKNSNAQSWIYYVNGTEAQIGVSNYKIKPGDVVSFKYEKSN